MWCTKYKEEIKQLKEQIKILKNRKKRRTNLSRKTGYTRVSESESLEMYEMYQQGMQVSDIGEYLHRSTGCVSSHIRKHLEK